MASSDSIVNRPCMDVDLFSKEDPNQLSSYPAVAKQTIQVSDWVLHIVKEIPHSVGLPCEGFEE